MATPDLTGAGSDPTHHVVLYDGTTELGFVVTDQGGDLDERTFRRFPFATPNDPYITEKQASFGGGFGQDKFEDDRSKYWKSEGVDTTKDKIALGPVPHYGEGLYDQAVNFQDYSDETFSWTTLEGTEQWIAMSFTTPATFASTNYVKFWVQKIGSPSANLLVRLYSNSGGDPDSLLATATIAPTELDNTAQWFRKAISYNLGNSTTYHLVFTMSSAGSTTSGYKIGGNGTQANAKKSSAGSSWASADNDIFFRLESTGTSSATMRFFEYKGQLYFVQSFDGTTTDTLWMNGWRGACDVNSGQLDNLYDATQSWSTYITGDEVIDIIAGPYSGLQEDWRLANKASLGELTNAYLPVTPDWDKAHTVNDEYLVKNTDWWFERSTDYSLAKVSDIAVVNGMIFFCRGNNRSVMLHREYNDLGTWDAGETINSGVNADLALVERDPVSGNFIWFAQNATAEGDMRPDVVRSRVTAWDDNGMNSVYFTTVKPSEWVSADGDVPIGAEGANRLKIGVKINKILTVGIGAPGATYTNGQFQVTIVDAGSSGTAKCTVTVSGGAITSIDSLDVVGYNYTLGDKTVTGLSGGDGNARIEITALDGFSTGLLAYTNLTNADGDAVTVDMRLMDRVRFDIMYSVWNAVTKYQTLDVGDLSLVFSDELNCANELIEVDIPKVMKSGDYFGGEDISLPTATPTTAGAEAIASIGFKLNTAKNKSFNIHLMPMPIRGFTDNDIVPVGFRDGDDITGLDLYGDPETLWVFTESGMGEVTNNRFKPVPLRELNVAHHPNNGRGHEVHDVYLLFTWRGRLQRYFRQNLEDLGPDFPTGLIDIAGDIVDVVTYPGRVYAAVDGGRNGKSMIICYKGGAWHEVWTSFSGERIRKLYIQAIQGHSDKLWASVGSFTMWFPITLDATQLPANSDYLYRPTGYLDTSWIYTEDMELDKFMRSVIMVRNRATDADLDVNMYYQIDDEDADWTEMTNVDDLTASAKEFNFSDGTAGASIQGNRVRFRIELHTFDITKSPVVRSIQTRLYRLPEIRYSWTWIAKASSISINLRGDEEKTLGTQATVLAGLAKLDEWASSLTQLTVETGIDAFNGSTVILEPVPYQLLTIVNDEGIEEDVLQVSVNDI